MVTVAGTLRQVETPCGLIRYTQIRKRVKRFHLRISRDGRVMLTIPWQCGDRQGEELIREKSGWITTNLQRLQTEAVTELPPEPPRDACQKVLQRAVERVYPLVIPFGVEMPTMKIRRMRSQWGNCHWNQGYITLNLALARCPEELQEYVALHELVHFLHHDHGRGFYETMDRLMPDWPARRRKLRRYGGALIQAEN